MVAHALAGCSPAGRDWEGVLGLLTAPPSWHSVRVGAPGLPSHMSTWGEGSTGAHGYLRTLHGEGRGRGLE